MIMYPERDFFLGGDCVIRSLACCDEPFFLSVFQVKTYCEEGTPVCFSRVSSLSSLHSSEAQDSVDQGRPVMLQSIDESDKGGLSTSVIENKNAIGMKTALVDRDQR